MELYNTVFHIQFCYVQYSLTTSHIHDASRMVPCVFKAWKEQYSYVSLHFHLSYITHVISIHTYQFHMCARYIFSVLPACKSILRSNTVLQSNGTSATISRNPISHCVITNVCWLLVHLSLIR